MFLILEGMNCIHESSAAKLHFVLESGHRNRNEAGDIFAEVKKEVQRYGLDVLGDVTFADKDNCDREK
jgi:hypothetical protein